MLYEKWTNWNVHVGNSGLVAQSGGEQATTPCSNGGGRPWLWCLTDWWLPSREQRTPLPTSRCFLPSLWCSCQLQHTTASLTFATAQHLYPCWDPSGEGPHSLIMWICLTAVSCRSLGLSHMLTSHITRYTSAPYWHQFHVSQQPLRYVTSYTSIHPSKGFTALSALHQQGTFLLHQ